MQTFANYPDAKAAAERIVRDAASGSQAAGRTASQSRDALAALQRLESFRPPCASAALAASGALPEVLADSHQLNYVVKSSLLLSFLKSAPAVSARLKAPVTADRKFKEVVKSAQDAAVLVLVY